MKVVGLPVHLWSQNILEKEIGMRIDVFLVDKDTMMLAELFWARNFVRLGDSNPQNPLRWWSTKRNYRFNCGERFSCKSNILF